MTPLSLYPGEPKSRPGMSLGGSAAPGRHTEALTPPRAPAQPYQPLHADDSKEIPAAFEALNQAGKRCQLGTAPIPAGKEQEQPRAQGKAFPGIIPGICVCLLLSEQPSRIWPCFLGFQVFPGPADVRKLSWHGLIPQGSLHQFIIPASCLINTLSRWEKWSREWLGVHCLRVGSLLEQHQNISLPRFHLCG